MSACDGQYGPCANRPRWIVVVTNAWAREHNVVSSRHVLCTLHMHKERDRVEMNNRGLDPDEQTEIVVEPL